MSVLRTCDYCGAVIEAGHLHVALTAVGHVPASNALGWAGVNRTVGHYHTQPVEGSDDPPCWQRIIDAIELIQDFGPSLERIPTISGQAVAARRRKHRRERPTEQGD